MARDSFVYTVHFPLVENFSQVFVLLEVFWSWVLLLRLAGSSSGSLGNLSFAWPLLKRLWEMKKKKASLDLIPPLSTNNATRRPVYSADSMLCVDWLVSLIYCFSWIWLAKTNCPIFLRLDRLCILTERPNWNYLKIILNRTVLKNWRKIGGLTILD